MNFIGGYIFAGKTGEQTRESLDLLVSGAKFAPGSGALDQESLEDDGSGKARIKDGGVTEQKIADEAVTSDKIADDAVTGSKIEDGAITPSKFSGSLNATAQARVLTPAALPVDTWTTIVSASITPRRTAAKIIVCANFYHNNLQWFHAVRLTRDGVALITDGDTSQYRLSYVYLDTLSGAPASHTYAVQMNVGGSGVTSPTTNTDNTLVLMEV